MLSVVNDEEITGADTEDVSNVPLFVLGSNDEPEKKVVPDDKGTEIPMSSYIITFKPLGGSVSQTVAIVGENNKLPELPTPTRANCVFLGWYTAADGGTEVTEDTVFDKDTVVYAQWLELYAITASLAGDGSVEYTVTSELPEAQTVYVAVALYEESGKLREIKMKQFKFTGNSTGTLEFDTAPCDTDYVKALLLNESYAPLCSTPQKIAATR